LHGKQKWYPLETDVLSVARLRLPDKAAEVAKLRGSLMNVEAGRGTMSDLMEVYVARTKADADLRPASITGRLVSLKKLQKTWPGIEAMAPKQITPAQVFAWAGRFKLDGTKYVPPGAKKAIKGNSATSVNGAIDTLRRLMDIALERGQIHTNPVTVRPPAGRLKKKIIRRRLVLPGMPQVAELFATMENNGSPGGWGAEAADLCRFLTFSGERIGEVPRTTWQCVEWERGQMRIPGYKSASSDRHIPLFPALAALLRRIIERRNSAARFNPGGETQLKPIDPVFRLKECQKTIDAACRKLGMQRLTHHDFRHLFATICIESGVDIPTVASWMGHNDGGVLAMQTYGHLRRDHSQAAAQRVQFDGLVPPRSKQPAVAPPAASVSPAASIM
jgi:integrase